VPRGWCGGDGRGFYYSTFRLSYPQLVSKLGHRNHDRWVSGNEKKMMVLVLGGESDGLVVIQAGRGVPLSSGLPSLVMPRQDVQPLPLSTIKLAEVIMMVCRW
jgi:hypothetical protein